jgi:hypothetical protein
MIGILVKLFGKTIDVKALQSEKIPSPINVTAEPRCTDTSDEHLLNTPPPKTVTLSGNTTDVKAEQS